MNKFLVSLFLVMCIVGFSCSSVSATDKEYDYYNTVEQNKIYIPDDINGDIFIFNMAIIPQMKAVGFVKELYNESGFPSGAGSDATNKIGYKFLILGHETFYYEIEINKYVVNKMYLDKFYYHFNVVPYGS
jgi:hypothetical protein